MMRAYTFHKGFGLVCVSLILISLAMTSTLQAAPDKVIELRLGSWWPTTHTMAAVMKDWIKDIEIETGGIVKVTHFPSGQIVTDKDALEKVSRGIADMAPVICEYFPSKLPLSQVIGLPFLFTNSKNGGKVLKEMRKHFDSEFEANKLKIMWGFTPSPYPLLTAKKPVQKLEDWKGLRIRTAGSIQAEAVKAFGGFPTVIFAGEMYTGLQRGTIDGILIPASSATSFKMEEIINHVTNHGISTPAIILSMNLDLWKSLPKSIQDKLMVANEKTAERTGVERDNAETEVINAWRGRGIKFYTLSNDELVKWKKVVEPMWNSWIQENEAKGRPAQKIAQEVRSCAEKSR